jgi:ribosomal protein S18 acetylase RimI-like enzyme
MIRRGNKMNIQLKQANPDHLDTIMDVYLRCKKDLDEKGLLQWNEVYPSREYFEEEMTDGNLYVLMIDENIAGSATLNEWQSPEWSEIPWKLENEWVIHALFLDPLQQGNGLGKIFMEKCEEFAREKGFESIRLDAYSRNTGANYLYEKMGYEYRGSVYFTSKPEGHREYRCYEKALTL